MSPEAVDQDVDLFSLVPRQDIVHVVRVEVITSDEAFQVELVFGVLWHTSK